MDRFGARPAACIDDFLNIKIGLRRRCRTYRDRLVGHLHMERGCIRLRIDGNCGNPHPPRGLDDPAGDLSPVGYEDFPEHKTPRPDYDGFVLGARASAVNRRRE
jgi:hypothetical protein